jgi:hypothetical protein
LEDRKMRIPLLATIFACLLLAGCVPDFVSVSRDGTIALSLTEEGDLELGEKDRHVYLTNANADFLIKIEELKDCMFPEISPSGKAIAALAEDGLIVYDRETKEQKVIYSPPESANEWSVFCSAWSPDEKKIAFFAGEFEDVPDCTLNLYHVDRKKLEVLAVRTGPRAAWLPDSKRLLYLSFPPKIAGNDGPPFGNLKMINVETKRKRTLARKGVFAYSEIAVFPQGQAVAFPCAEWGDLDIGPGGIQVPLVLKKQLLRRHEGRGEEQKPGKRGEREAHQSEQPEERAATRGTQSRAGQEQAPEKEFVLQEGQPFHPHICAVSPDGKRIACVRFVPGKEGSPEPSGEGRVEGAAPEEEDEREEKPRGTEEDKAPDQGWEVCVVNDDGTNVVPILRGGDDGFMQVLWVSNDRLICLNSDTIVAVDADGKNALDLIATIKTKFADRFKRPEKEAESAKSSG